MSGLVPHEACRAADSITAGRTLPAACRAVLGPHTLAPTRHALVYHAYDFRRYAGSGWWAGVPQQGVRAA